MAARDFATIRPRLGLGTLRFGATRDEVRGYFSVENPIVEDHGTSWEWWNFDVARLSAAFDRDNGDLLVAFRSERPDATLLGKRFIGVPQQAALRLATEAGLGAYASSDIVFGWQAEFEAHELELCFGAGACEAISWRAATGADDRTQWPPRLVRVPAR